MKTIYPIGYYEYYPVEYLSFPENKWNDYRLDHHDSLARLLGDLNFLRRLISLECHEVVAV